MRRLRFLLACLLLAVIPLRGMAGASVLACALGHGQGDVAAVPAHQGHQGHQGHHDMASPAHEPSHHDTTSVHANLSHDQCAGFTACCHGAAVNEAPRVPAFATPTLAIAAPAAVALRVRATPPPDRPPRA